MGSLMELYSKQLVYSLRLHFIPTLKKERLQPTGHSSILNHMPDWSNEIACLFIWIIRKVKFETMLWSEYFFKKILNWDAPQALFFCNENINHDKAEVCDFLDYQLRVVSEWSMTDNEWYTVFEEASSNVHNQAHPFRIHRVRLIQISQALLILMKAKCSVEVSMNDMNTGVHIPISS